METVAFVQQFASPALDRFFILVSDLGSSQVYIVLLLFAYLVLDPRLGQRLGAAVLFGFYLNFHLKGLVGTQRPFIMDPALGRTPEAVPTSGPGFPSAHAQMSLTFWGYAAWWLQRPWFWPLAVLVVLLISLSRVYLGMHFLVDIVGGLGIGLLYTAVFAFAEPLWIGFRSGSRRLRVTLGVVVPFLLLVFLPPPGLEADLLMGGLAAFLSAPFLLSYKPSPALWRRLAVFALGVVLVFGVLAGSSALLSEDLKRTPVVGFVRYLLLGYTGLLLTPRLAQMLHLAPLPAKPVRKVRA